MIDLVKLAQCQLLGVSREGTTPAQLWNTNAVALVFLRHFG